MEDNAYFVVYFCDAKGSRFTIGDMNFTSIVTFAMTPVVYNGQSTSECVWMIPVDPSIMDEVIEDEKTKGE